MSMLAVLELRAVCMILAVLATCTSSTFAQENLDPINVAPGARTWRWSGQGIQVRLTHIVPDQLRGFFQARGFKPKDTEIIAAACVFQTVIRNEREGPVVISDLKSWQVITPETKQSLLIREHWEQVWETRQVPKSARLAFRWAWFPTQQRFHHGDWNMGMSSYGLPPGSKFDLILNFEIDGKRISGRIENIECANPEKG